MSLFLTMLTCKKVLQEEVIEAIITIMKKHSFELISKVKVSEIKIENIIHSKIEHREPVYSHTKCESAVFLGIDFSRA